MTDERPPGPEANVESEPEMEEEEEEASLVAWKASTRRKKKSWVNASSMTTSAAVQISPLIFLGTEIKESVQLREVTSPSAPPPCPENNEKQGKRAQKTCTCGRSTSFCTVDCWHLSLRHNSHVHDSIKELNLWHFHSFCKEGWMVGTGTCLCNSTET